MALHFHNLKVINIRRETSDCVSIAFEIPEELKEQFIYRQGQSIAIKSKLDEVRRSYSICSSPIENEIRIAVKKVPRGIFSNYAIDKLREGDILEILPPTGTFYTEVKQGQKKQYVFFAAGSGITPVISQIKTILFMEEESSVTLVYGNRNLNSIIFKEELEGIKDKYLERFRIIYILSRQRTEADINYGRIDEKKCRQLSALIPYGQIDDFFICGPEKMIFTIKDFLVQEGISPEKVHFELFTTPERPAQAPPVKGDAGPAGGSDVTVMIDGRSIQFKLDYDSNTILDAGLATGTDLPYSCKGGVCSTCRAKLIEGKVEMDVCYGLEDSEVAEGYILTCQSHPRSEKVVVDFDE